MANEASLDTDPPAEAIDAAVDKVVGSLEDGGYYASMIEDRANGELRRRNVGNESSDDAPLLPVSGFGGTFGDDDEYGSTEQPNPSVMGYCRLIWKNRDGRSQHIIDLFNHIATTPSRYRAYFTDVDHEDGGTKVWRRDLKQWWHKNWWIIPLILLAFFGAWVLYGRLFGPGQNAYGETRVSYAPRYLATWTDPEKAKLASHTRCVPVSAKEIETKRFKDGPWIQEVADNSAALVGEDTAGIVGIHFGTKYGRCFASVLDPSGQGAVFMMNPTIVRTSSDHSPLVESSEFCPDAQVEMLRPTGLVVDFTTVEGTLRQMQFTAPLSGVVAHLIDQLEGICICDNA